MSDDAPTFDQRLAAAKWARAEALNGWRCGQPMGAPGGAPSVYMCQGTPRCDGPVPGCFGCSDCYSFRVTDARSTEQIVRDMESWMRT
jgi:hypothetical protein